jgi:anti-sigma B factor antagonist
MSPHLPPIVLGLVTVSITDHGDVWVAALEGEIDISNVDMVAHSLDQLPNQLLGLIVDLTGVGYLDSSGISLLHNLATRMGQRAQGLVVVSSESSNPYRVLTLTEFTARAPVVADLQEAIRLVRETSA